MSVKKPERVTLWGENADGDFEIYFGHPLSDGFGIPAVVVKCPNERNFTKHSGLTEYGDKVTGVSFDECSQCPYFLGLDFSQVIICKCNRV
jgi:hypothetical protein